MALSVLGRGQWVNLLVVIVKIITMVTRQPSCRKTRGVVHSISRLSQIDWIPGVPWEPGTGLGSPNVNMTLFNFEGQALPSIGIFRNPAAICEHANPDSSPCVVGG
jgi:hypothetical protein